MANHKNTRRAETLASEQRDGLMSGGNLLSLADSLFDQSTTAGLDQLSKALRWLHYGTNWRIENPTAWAAFEEYASECIEQGKLLSGNALHAIIRRKDFVNIKTGRTTRLNRNVLPLFVRWLLVEHPDLTAELRRSYFDLLFRTPTEEEAARD